MLWGIRSRGGLGVLGLAGAITILEVEMLVLVERVERGRFD